MTKCYINFQAYYWAVVGSWSQCYRILADSRHFLVLKPLNSTRLSFHNQMVIQMAIALELGCVRENCANETFRLSLFAKQNIDVLRIFILDVFYGSNLEVT